MPSDAKNAPGGGVAAPSPTSGVRPTPNKHKKETGMSKSNPRPRLEEIE